MTIKNIKVKSLPLKWLLISALFVSLFSSAASVGLASLSRQKAQTEFVFSNNVRARRHTAYHKLSGKILKSVLFSRSEQYKYAIIAYGRFSKVSYDQLSAHSFFKNAGWMFRCFRIIPQSKDDDLCISLIG